MAKQKKNKSEEIKDPLDIITVSDEVLKSKQPEEAITRDATVANMFPDDTGREQKQSEPAMLDQTVMHFEDATGRDDNKNSSMVKFEPKEKTWQEKVARFISQKILGVKDPLESFAIDYNTVSDPEAPSEESGQAFANMNGTIQDMKMRFPRKTKAFVEKNMNDMIVKISGNGNPGAIELLGKMTDDRRVPSILSRLARKKYEPKEAAIQNIIITAYTSYMQAQTEANFLDNSAPYVEVMTDLIKDSKNPQNRLMAIQDINDFMKQGSLDEKQVALFADSVKGLLSLGSYNLDRNATDVVIDILENDLIKGDDKKRYEDDIKIEIGKNISKKETLEKLATYPAFIATASEKIVYKITTVFPGQLSDTFKESIKTVKEIFEDNQDIVEKTDLNIPDIFEVGLSKAKKNSETFALKNNAGWQLQVKEAQQEVLAYFARAKADIATRKEKIGNMDYKAPKPDAHNL